MGVTDAVASESDSRALVEGVAGQRESSGMESNVVSLNIPIANLISFYCLPFSGIYPGASLRPESSQVVPRPHGVSRILRIYITSP